MNPGGYTAEVIGLSPLATEKDVSDFFALCGKIDHVEIVRAGEHGSTAYVTFSSSHALETAVLLSGATILDQHVCIARWGHYENEYDYWNPPWKSEEASDSTVQLVSANHEFLDGTGKEEECCVHPRPKTEIFGTCQGHAQEVQYFPSAGEAVTMAQDVVKAMVSKGYVLGKDALGKAKALDESYHLSATAAAKVADLGERTGLADKIFAGVEAVRSVDQRFHISENTKSAVSATSRTAVAAATAVVDSSYFSKGALWVSGALSRAAKAASDLGSQGVNKQ